MTRPAKLTKSSSSSSSVELSTGMQRCSCCFQQREAEIFRSLAGHGDCNLKRDSNSVTSDEAQTSLTSAEAKKREVPDQWQHDWLRFIQVFRLMYWRYKTSVSETSGWRQMELKEQFDNLGNTFNTFLQKLRNYINMSLRFLANTWYNIHKLARWLLA